MLKGATVLVLDVTLQCADALRKACDLCTNIVTEKMVCAPSDEVAVVFAGTDKSNTTPSGDVKHLQFNNITVAVELGPATKQTLVPIADVQAGATVQRLTTQAFDFVDALHVATAMLQARTSQKKYSRSIFLITDARHEVRHKEELLSLIDALQRDQVTVVVVVADFQALSEGVSSHEGQGGVVRGDAVVWAELSTKAQNEKILEALCTELGPPSTFVSLSEGLAGFAMPLCRKMRQQPLSKIALRIGDVRIATRLFTFTQEERLPTLHRSTRDGAAVFRSIEYVSTGATDEQPRVLAEGERVEAFFLGADCVPCCESDLDAMKIKGPRSLETIGFVRETDVESYLLMGGTRALLPLADDKAGQLGFNALVEAMASSGKAMLVRFVRTMNATPSLCVCFARTAESTTKQRHMVLAPLPFADDTRDLCFSEYPELQFSAAEEQLMSELIDGLSVDGSVLAPQDTFNPLLQQYYATLQAKLSTLDPWPGKESAKAVSSDAAIPELLPTLKGTSTDFFAEGSEVYKVMLTHRSTLESCASMFPYEDDADAALRSGNGAGVGGKPWFQCLTTPSSLLSHQVGAPLSSVQGSGSAASTTAVSMFGDATRCEEAEAASDASEVTSIRTIPHNTTNAAVSFEITTVDPVGDLSSIVQSPAATEEQITKAKDDMSDLVWELLRKSVKDSLYRKCVACIHALRQLCLAQGDAAYYNDFLLKLEVVAQQCGRHVDFWGMYVVERRGGARLWPITAHECKSSIFPDDAAAGSFLRKERFASAITLERLADADADADADWLAEVQ